MGRGGKGRPLFQSDADRDVVAIAWAKGGCKRTSSELEAGAFMPTRVGLGASAGRPRADSNGGARPAGRGAPHKIGVL